MNVCMKIFMLCLVLSTYIFTSSASMLSESYSLTIRLHPGDDLEGGIIKAFESENLSAASVVAVVGSVKRLNIRLANTDTSLIRENEHFEIVSLSGTIAREIGNCKVDSHIHISVADKNGNVLGGHLFPGNIVYTTAEITLLVPKTLEFLRAPDSSTGYLELEVHKKSLESNNTPLCQTITVDIGNGCTSKDNGECEISHAKEL